MVNLKVKIGKLELKNPIITASGTFGYGFEYEDFFDINQLGAFVTKGITLEPREGNPPPRMVETAAGMINAIGLQNKGIEYFIKHIYPKIKKYKTQIIVNINGSTIEEYSELAEKLQCLEDISAIELNISCPNVKRGGIAFGTDPETAASVTKIVRKKYKKTLIVKLSPNVTDITSIASAIEQAGADALSLVNTFLGMAVDINTQRPVLSTITGGVSGPCIKPIALRMVWQVAKTVKLPVIGIGGIMSAEDAIEFLLAGATAIQIGTANFIYPDLSIKIINNIKKYLITKGIKDVNQLKEISKKW